MNKQPLLILLLCFIFGILLREYLVLDSNLGYFILGFSFLLLTTVFIKTSFFQKVKYYFVGFFFFNLGFFLHSENSKIPKLPQLKEKETIVFKLDSKLNSNEKNKRYSVEILGLADKRDQSQFPVKSVISIPKDQVDLDYQHYYKAEVYINEVQKPTYNYQFDYKKFLERDRIYYQAYLPNEIVFAPKDKLSVSEFIKQSRLTLLQKIDKTELSPKVIDFVKGIILADRTDMDKETVDDFNQTGLVHLLAISGTHMVIIFWMISWLLTQIIPFGFRKFATILSLVFIWCFAVFIDFGPSVSRACIMITCYYTMVLLQRKSDLLHSLALSAFIILMIDTQQFFKVGFQLSYVAVLGLWWLAPSIQKLFGKPKYKIQKFFIAIVAMTLSAQIATLPLAIYYFHQFSFISIFANLIIIPLSEIIIISSLLMVVFIGADFRNGFLYQVFDYFIAKVLSAIHWFSGFESLMTRNVSLNLTEAFVLMLAVYLLKFVFKDFWNLKSQLRFVSILILFFGLRLGFNFVEYQNDEVLIHQYYKEKVISIKEGNQVYFWIPNDDNLEKIKSFIINPYLTDKRVNNYYLQSYHRNVNQFKYNGRFYLIND